MHARKKKKRVQMAAETTKHTNVMYETHMPDEVTKLCTASVKPSRYRYLLPPVKPDDVAAFTGRNATLMPSWEKSFVSPKARSAGLNPSDRSRP
jgi:hypothetical protein